MSLLQMHFCSHCLYHVASYMPGSLWSVVLREFVGLLVCELLKFFCTLVKSVISNRNGNSVASLKVGCLGGEAVSFVSNFFRCDFCFVGYLFSRGMCHNTIYVLQLYFLLAAEGFVCIRSFSKCQLFTFVCILSFFKCQLFTL